MLAATDRSEKTTNLCKDKIIIVTENAGKLQVLERIKTVYN